MKTTCLVWSDRAAIEALAAILRKSELIVGSSDTVLGFLANATAEGFQSLNAVKMRSEKPYLLLIGAQEKVSLLCDEIPDSARLLMNNCWPGPLTIILKAKKGLPAYMTSADGTIALRMPAHEGLQALLKGFDALFSTSANVAGQPVPDTIGQLDPSIRDAVAACVVDDHAHAEHKQPSTIVDCSGDQVRIVREGAYSVSDITKILGSI